MSGALTRSPPIVNDSPKDLKQRGCSMDFVDYNQPSCLSTQERIGVLQATLVGGAFQIKVESRGLSPPGCNGPS
jgi:hypothetical protein